MLTLGARTFSPVLVVFAGYLWVYRQNHLHLLVLQNSQFQFFSRQLTARIDDTVILTLDVGALDLGVACTNHFWVDVQTSEFCAREFGLGEQSYQHTLTTTNGTAFKSILSTCGTLLTKKSLQLQIHLRISLARQTIAFDNLCPVSNAKQHQCFSKRLWFLLGPACTSIENQYSIRRRVSQTSYKTR